MLPIWRISVRNLGITLSDRHTFTFLVATRSALREQDALKLARTRYSDEWWATGIITAIDYVGNLELAEGIELPKED